MAPPSDLPPPPPPAASYPYPTAPAPAPPSVPLSERWSAEALAAKGPWALLAMVSQAIGLLLLFIGTLVIVVAGSTPADCFTSTCGTSVGQNVAYGIETARLLWTIGLFGLAAGAGLRLQVVNVHPTGTTPEETRLFLARRRGEFILLIVSILLLFLVLVWSAAPLPTPPV